MMGCGLSGLGKGHCQACFSVFIETAFSIGVFEASSSSDQNAHFFKQSTCLQDTDPLPENRVVEDVHNRLH